MQPASSAAASSASTKRATSLGRQPRPITLWPFAGEALAKATRKAKLVLVFEINSGQMIDDVRLHVEDHKSKVRAIGGVSFDESGLNLGPLMDAPVIRERIEQAMKTLPSGKAKQG